MTKLIVAFQIFANAPKNKYKALVKNPLKANPEGSHLKAMQFRGFSPY